MTSLTHMIRHSEAGTWMFCRRLHHLSYTRGLSPLPEDKGRRMPAKGGRDLGTIVHAGVEEINQGNSELAHEAAYAKMQEIRSFNLPEGEELPPLTKEDDKAWWDVWRYAGAMITSYDEWMTNGADAGAETLGVEHEWEARVPGTDYVYYGKMDLVTRSPKYNGVVIEDVKTVSKELGKAPHTADFQLRTYGWAWWRTQGEVPRRAGHRQVLKVLRGQSSDCDNPGISMSAEVLEAHEGHLTVLAEEIVKARDHDVESPYLYPRTSRDCGWRCSFKEVCNMIDDGDDYEFVLEQHYYRREQGDDE